MSILIYRSKNNFRKSEDLSKVKSTCVDTYNTGRNKIKVLGKCVDNYSIDTDVSEDLTKDYQVLLAFFGRRSNVLSKDERGKKTLLLSSGNYIETKNILWRISIHRESASSVKRHHHKKEEYKGKVYCPDTVNELFYIRREGMSLWMSTK